MILKIKKNGYFNWLMVLSFCLINATAWAKDYKSYQCYVLGTDTLHYLINIDAPSFGYAMSMARHVRITSESTGPVDIRDVMECAEQGKPFKNKQAQKLEQEGKE